MKNKIKNKRNKQMVGEIIRIDTTKESAAVYFKLDMGRNATMCVGENDLNYHNWNRFKVDDLVGGLEWKDIKKGLIQSDSPVCLILPEGR